MGSRLASILLAVLLLGATFYIIVYDPFLFQEEKNVYQSNKVTHASHLKNAWDEERTKSASLIYDRTDQTFKMWYVGSGRLDRGGIGYITSSNGVEWEDPLNGEAVIEKEKLWEDGGFTGVTVLHDGTGYHMWYSARRWEGDQIQQIGYATSKDGIAWAKHSTNPVFTPGDTDEWDSNAVEQPMVIKEQGTYKMWYTGSTESMKESKRRTEIGYATSPDGIRWTKYENNPVLSNRASWNSGGIGGAHVISHGNGQVYEMWYHGVDGKGHARLGRSFSEDGLQWVDDEENNPLTDDSNYVFWNPFVVAAGEEYYFWFDRSEHKKDEDVIHYSMWPHESALEKLSSTYIPTDFW